jgi:FkbM family methyltransferase
LRRLPPGRLKWALQRAQWEALREFPRPFVRARTVGGGVFAGNTEDVIDRYLYVFRMWEPSITRWMLDLLRPGDVFVDVGANVGYHAIQAAIRVGPIGQVVAFEALPVTAQRLRQNVMVNRVAVDVHECVASDGPGAKRMFREEFGNIGHSNTAGGRFLVEDDMVVAKTVDSVVGPELRARVRLVKVDVEGDELNVLRGMQELLTSLRAGTFVLVEVSPDGLRRRNQNADEIFDLMAALGFAFSTVHNDYDVADYAPVKVVPPLETVVRPTDMCDVIFTKTGG